MLLAGAAAGLQTAMGPAGEYGYQSMMLTAPLQAPVPASVAIPFAGAGGLGYGAHPYAGGGGAAAVWQPVQGRVGNSGSTMYGHRVV
jgi:hypothetical protein